FDEYRNKLPDGTQAIFVASRGRYNFLGSKFLQESSGHRFERLRVVQDEHTFGFVQGDYQWTNPYGEGIRGMEDVALFALPATSGFDPGKPWRLDLLVNGEGAAPVTVAFGLDYPVPDLQALTAVDETRRAQPVAAEQAVEGERK